MDREVIFEGLSALLGATVQPLSGSKARYSGNTHVVDLMTTYKQELVTVDTFLPAVLFGYNALNSGDLLSALFNGMNTSEEEESDNSAIRKEMFIDENEFFDPKHDYDFTNKTDSRVFKRGGEPYKRPCGWNRIGLKVKGKYSDGDAWLGPRGRGTKSAPGEWPVSYHGTSIEGAKGIIQSGYKTGPHAAFGRGVYSTPDIDVAERRGYTKTFTSQKTGKTYKIALQNRINPEHREICTLKDFWLVPVPKGTSAEREREIVDRAIRPYGLLLKEVKEEVIDVPEVRVPAMDELLFPIVPIVAGVSSTLLNAFFR
ncbi:uncharacterized protein LOC134095213 [Sardina pilchardus]|uniref:uncharacterized protein LOC134095213 n=1 Tax=Sardina pilchardus TaxID=27697 RepID=UPI002E13B1F3